MKRIIFFFIWVFPLVTFCQVGNFGAYGPSYSIINKCIDSLDLGTNYISFYEVVTLRPGQTTTTAKFRSTGSSFTPPAGTITVGNCPASVSISKDSLRDFEIIELCDQNAGTSTPFLRILVRVSWPTNGLGSTYIFAQINLSGGTYTTTGNILTGPCTSIVTPTYTNTIVAGSSSSFSFVYESWSVINMGLGTATIAINGGSAMDILEGETVSCSAYVDENTRQLIKCSTFVVDATGGGYIKVITRKN